MCGILYTAPYLLLFQLPMFWTAREFRPGNGEVLRNVIKLEQYLIVGSSNALYRINLNTLTSVERRSLTSANRLLVADSHCDTFLSCDNSICFLATSNSLTSTWQVNSNTVIRHSNFSSLAGSLARLSNGTRILTIVETTAFPILGRFRKGTLRSIAGSGSARNSTFNLIAEYMGSGNFLGSVYVEFSHNGFVYFLIRPASGNLEPFLTVVRFCQNDLGIWGSFRSHFEIRLRCTATGYVTAATYVQNFIRESEPEPTILVTSLVSTNRIHVCAFSVRTIDRMMADRFSACLQGMGTVGFMRDRTLPCPHLSNSQRENADVCSVPGMAGRGLELGHLSSLQFIDLSLHHDAEYFTALATISCRGSLYLYAGSSRSSLYQFRIHSALLSSFIQRFSLDESSNSTHIILPSHDCEDVYVMTAQKLSRVSVTDCSSSVDCLDCLAWRFNHCGWCVVENKCSRQSQCRDGNSTSSTRWISSNTSTNHCIRSTTLPNEFEIDNNRSLIQLTVSVGGPGLPVALHNENYMCYFEDSESRFNITVPAVVITPWREFSCNISLLVPAFDGARAVLEVGFISSVIGVVFGRTPNATTLYQCGNLTLCSDCIAIPHICGWCVISKLCRRSSEYCTDPGNFLQRNESTAIRDVCPFLDLKDGTLNYTQHVRIPKNLKLTTRNMPNIVPGHSYLCLYSGYRAVTATWNSNSSVTCHSVDEVLFSMANSSMEVIDIEIVWVGVSKVHKIEILDHASLIIYDCKTLGIGCSSCISKAPMFECGWCNAPKPICSISNECNYNITRTVGDCPYPMITGFSPSSAPPSGGTTVTITGINLGVNFSDFQVPGSNITISGIVCTPLNLNYTAGLRVLCQTGPGMELGEQSLTINLIRSWGVVTGRRGAFMVVVPRVSSLHPRFGPIAGGTRLVISGTWFNAGNSVRVVLNGVIGTECTIITRNAEVIICISNRAPEPSNYFPLILQFDNQIVQSFGAQFAYRPNPVFTSLQPQYTIPVGGIKLNFTGRDFDVARHIRFTIFGVLSDSCTLVASTLISCITPRLTNLMDIVEYTLELDNVPSPNFSDPAFQFSVRPNPTGLLLATEKVVKESQDYVRIFGQNWRSVDLSEVTVYVGGQVCDNPTLNGVGNQIVCISPANPSLDDDDRAAVTVTIGHNLVYRFNETIFYGERQVGDRGSDFPVLVVTAIVIPLLILALLILIGIIAFMWFDKQAIMKRDGHAKYGSHSTIKKSSTGNSSSADEKKARSSWEVKFLSADEEKVPSRWFKTAPEARVLSGKLSRIISRKEKKSARDVRRVQSVRVTSMDEKRNRSDRDENEGKSIKQKHRAVNLEDKEEQNTTLKIDENHPGKCIIHRKDILLLDPIGVGNFGTVYNAQRLDFPWSNDENTNIAIRILKGKFERDEIVKIFGRIYKLLELSHPNIMTLMGVYIHEDSRPAIVMPFMENGSLMRFLMLRKRDYFITSHLRKRTFSVRKTLLEMCYQILLGMLYLISQKIIHRNLAARNCMVDKGINIRIADYGLSKEISRTKYYRQNRNELMKFQLKWMAPESIMEGTYTEKSAVWSFGVTCWEIFAIKEPYGTIEASDLLRLLSGGLRLSPPKNGACTSRIYSAMYQCWNINLDERPSFEDLETLLSAWFGVINESNSAKTATTTDEHGEDHDDYEEP